jgi:S-formylglutathione hydrolase FrmB
MLTTPLGCVGASYGGYSAFYLAGIHNNRFKTFIAHDGVFNTQSMFGTTEDSSAIGILVVRIGEGQCYSTKTYTTFNPINLVENGTRQY